MTVVRPNSIAGINSITVQTGQALNIHDASGNLIRSLTNSSGISTFASVEITKGTGDLKVGVSTFFVDQSAGRIGINTDVPDFVQHNYHKTDNVLALFESGDAAALISFQDNNSTDNTQVWLGAQTNDLRFAAGGSEAARIDSSGRLLISHAASRAVGNVTSQMQLEGTDASTGISICRNSNNASPPYISLAKSRGGAVGGTTVIQADDGLGSILFSGADGTDITNNAASILAAIDGTPGGNDTPGRLVLATTADGGTSPTERLRISADGGVKLTGHSERSVNALGNTTGSTTIKFATADIITATLTGTTTFANPTTESVGQSGSIILTQDGTGSRTASWGSQFKWVGGTAPTLTTTAAAVDRIDYLVVAADTIHCVASLDVK